MRAQLGVLEKVSEHCCLNRGKFAASSAERGFFPAVSPEAPCLPGGVRPRRRPAQLLGGSIDREFGLAKSDLAAAVPDFSGHPPPSVEGDPYDRPMDCGELCGSGRLRRGGLRLPRAESLCVLR